MSDAQRPTKTEAAYAEQQARPSAAPWTGDGEELYRHYGTTRHGAGLTDEYVDGEAALDWAQHGNPTDGERYHPKSEYSWREGKLWNDGRYGAADGSAEPYVAWEPPGCQTEDAAAGRAG